MNTAGEAAAKPDYINAPQSYEDFYTLYRSHVESLCRVRGIEPQNVQDTAADIMLRMYERDVIGMFDPTTKITHRGTSYEPRFKSFVSAHVEAYVRGKRQRQQQVSGREPLLCDKPVGESGARWIEIFGPAYADDYSAAEEHDLVTRLRTHLITIPRRSPADRCDLPALFDACVNMARTDGKINLLQLQDLFGVSSTAIWTWLKVMREACRPVLDRYLAAS